MATYIDIDGVSTWTEARGSGERTVVLLHGGLGNSDDLLDSIGSADLQASFRLFAFDRRGHGYTADTDDPFHYDDMAEHAIGVLEHLGAASKVHLVGWSDGGIVAMLVALRRPDLVDRLVLIGTNFHVDGIHELDFGDEAPAGLVEGYARRSPDGADHFPVVVEKFLAMATTEPTLTPDDLARLAHPTLVLVGDDDLVRLDHTVALYDALPAGRLCVVPGASHMVVIERPQLVASTIAEFLSSPEPPETFLPIRRRGR